jgi:hypothetical protein
MTRNFTARVPLIGFTTNVRGLRLRALFLGFECVLGARPAHVCEGAGAETGAGVLVALVIGPLAAVIGAATVVIVVVVVTVLTVMLTGPHVTKVGSVLVTITFPHWPFGPVGAGVVPSAGVEPFPSPPGPCG